MAAVTICEATAADKPALRALLSQHISEENLDAYYERLPTDRFFDPNDQSALYVAVEEPTDCLVGMTALTHYDSVNAIRDALNGETLPTAADLQPEQTVDSVGYLSVAYVAERCLREGVGRTLREHVEETARAHGLDALFAEVWMYDDTRDGRWPLRQSGYTEVFRSDEYWPSLSCSYCGDECECLGAVYRKLV